MSDGIAGLVGLALSLARIPPCYTSMLHLSPLTPPASLLCAGSISRQGHGLRVRLQKQTDGDESVYRQEVKELSVWCSLNNLELNMLKTVEMIVYFRRNPHALPQLTIMISTVTAVESFRFLGSTISQDLKWDNHIDSIVN